MTPLDIRRFICATALTVGIAAPGASQSVGDCDAATASAVLDANNVRACLYNNGGLFWKGAGPLYNVPKGTKANAIFNHTLWIGGLIDGELHMAASDYGPWEFWPGPIDEHGNPPTDCRQYDRMYSIYRSDIEAYERTGETTDDLRDWPYDLGAPVIDGDGNPDNYNLAGGDRPAIKGDQTVWWVMNDVGNEHAWSLTPPMQLEMRVTAYSYNYPRGLKYTTFYQYELVNRGANTIENTFFGTWVDPDLGDAGNDYVGSDSTLGLGFVYNGTDFDGGFDGYGDRPPALGFAFVQGPVAPPDGIDNDHDGEIDEPDERRSMSRFVYYSSDSTVQGNPRHGGDAYKYLRGLWLDNVPITYGGSGRGFSNTPTHFMFSGDPPEYWSEENPDGSGMYRNTPSDRRFLASTGPFTLDPGASEQITYAIVFSQGRDRLDSVQELKKDAAYVQNIFNAGFSTAQPPDAPRLTATALDGTIILKWDNELDSNNFLDGYDVRDPFLVSGQAPDSTYTLEGYEVYRFSSEADTVGESIATFDRANGVRRIFDVTGVDDQTGTEIIGMVADGTDSGIEHSLVLRDLTNYTTYYFGVRAYAYGPESSPKVLKSPMVRVSVEPSRPVARRGGTVVADSLIGSVLTAENGGVVHEGLGGGMLTAEIVDPLAVTGHTYRVDMLPSHFQPVASRQYQPVAYAVTDEESGDVVLDGLAAEAELGRILPLAENVVQFDGLSLSMSAPPPGPLDADPPTEYWAFIQVQGIGDGDACTAGAGSSFGCDQVGGNVVYGSFNGRGDWIMGAWGTGPEGSIGFFAPNDYEIRATDEVSYGYFYFSSGNVITVPAEIWDIGPTGPFGVNDPSDDVRMIPVLYSDDGGECYFGFGETEDGPFALGWPGTDRIYAYYPVAGATYDDWEAAAKPLVEADPKGCPTSPVTDAAAQLIDLDHDRPLQRLAWQMNPESADYRPEFIPVGNVIRFLTTKPNLPGDKFFIHTQGYAPKTHDFPTAKAALDLIGIVPNPYKGASDYEITATRDVVRFTNLPDVATIRIFNLGGTLITTLEKTPATTGLEWDLTNDNGYHIASGMYLVHVEVPGVGERVVKFGVVKKKR